MTTDTETPVVADTSVSADLLEALNVVTELGLDTVGQQLRVLAVDNVLLPVEEPVGDLERGRVLQDLDQALTAAGVSIDNGGEGATCSSSEFSSPALQ